LLLEEIEELKYQIENLDNELLLQNTEMNELRIQTTKEIKDMKQDLQAARAEMEFEVKDKKQEIIELKQEITDYQFQIADIKKLSDKLDKIAKLRTKEADELQTTLAKKSKHLTLC
jgi:hypothetical protein